MCDGLINPLKFNSILTSLLIWVYEYVTYESLILCLYAPGSIFDHAFLTDLSLINPLNPDKVIRFIWI